MNTNKGFQEIAVIGMSCKFPGANTTGEFWHNLKNGIESIKKFTNDELIQAGLSKEVIYHPNYIKSRGILDDITNFSNFKLSKSETEALGIESRVLLNLVWQALEDANIPPLSCPEKTSIFLGMNSNVCTNQRLFPTRFYSTTQIVNTVYNDPIHLATFLAYKFGLKGIAMNLYTACSTSLVALINACQDLLLGNSDTSIVASAYIDLPQVAGYLFEEEGILSADGHCRAFDVDASGTVLSNGAGVVILKRLEDALRRKDRIRAIIKGYGINNDGNLKTGYFAPAVKGQAQCIKQAYEKAGISFDLIDYIEAHGAATVVGDPIEFLALRRAFQLDNNKKSCGIGSVKTNIGHTTVVSGIASLLKTILMLENKALVPSLNFKKPNPDLNLEESPFFITEKYQPFNDTKKTIIAGVSNFGIGGTNAHVVLQNFIT